AVAASLAPSLPLLTPHHAEERVAGASMAPDHAEGDPLAPFQPEQPAEAAPIAASAVEPGLLFTSEESDVEEPEPELPAIDPPLAASTADPVRAWRSDMASEPATETRSDRARFSGLALILATLVGAVLGFAAGYMAKPRALQSAPPPEIAAAGGDNELKATPPAPPPGTSETGKAPTSALKAPKAPDAPTKIGRLLVRSTPSGANVDVDGVARGVTPLALQDLDLGARAITVSRRGYLAEERRIVLTEARPSRSVEVRLSQQPTAAARPSTPASLGKPATTTGALVIESRPIGAAVTVNDKPSGTTPVLLNELPPGEYRVTMTLPGYRPFTTTVRVVAGERARAAARLTEQEQE
ncbi:MAG TPA: PEGA domain-containing protein, partial [Vicinamibacterales bacterium]